MNTAQMIGSARLEADALRERVTELESALQELYYAWRDFHGDADGVAQDAREALRILPFPFSEAA